MPSTGSRVRLNRKARADLDGIFLYTALRWSPEQADRYITEIDEAMQGLARSPELGQKVDDIRADYYRYRAGSHLIFYRRLDIGIEVMRVLHQHMDIDRHL